MSCEKCGIATPSLNCLLCMSTSHCLLCKKTFCYVCSAPENHKCSFGNQERIMKTKTRLNQIKGKCDENIFKKLEKQLSKIEDFYKLGRNRRMEDREYSVSKSESVFEFFEVFEFLEISIYIIENTSPLYH